MEANNSQKKKPGLLWKVFCIINAVLLVLMLVGGVVANNYASIINMVLDTESTITVGNPGKIYYTADFENSADQVASAEAICESVVANGAVLLLNRENVLPLGSGAKVTLFGKGTVEFVYGDTGSGGMDTSTAKTLKQALEDDSYSVNPTLWDFYATGAGSEYKRENAKGAMNNSIADNSSAFIHEVPQSAYSSTEWNSVSEYGDAAIVVFGRVCGEGRDMAWFNSGDGDGNILSLTGEERDLLAKLADLKEGARSRRSSSC